MAEEQANAMVDISRAPLRLAAEQYEQDDNSTDCPIAKLKYQLLEGCDGDCQWRLCVCFAE